MAYEFHYTPTGTGVISGKEVLEQTEDAINDLGNTAISGVQEALDKAEQALTNSENAVDDAQTALNTANNAEGVAIQAQTDVGNLSGTVTNIGNRVTTAEGNISNLQGRMTTAEGNITNLQGRMTTAEGNIGNLQTAVSTAQATANSAQQTATTARQQSYVFRYSSTALTASSTNSNTLLDNTDNLKVGDKVIDSSGVLFSITAIDTVNSTFTIGTALIDLALDANVVHTSGNETVDGNKTFSKYITSDGSSTGDEYSNNARTNLWLMGNRDTEDVSGVLFDTFRQNTAQGTGLHILGFGIKENSVRYEGCRFSWLWDNNLNGYSFDFKPTTQGTYQAVKHNLGTSSDKWTTINGIKPSLLGFPNLNSGVDISGYISVSNGQNTLSTYTAPDDGWVSINLGRTSGALAILISNGSYAISGRDITYPDTHHECPAIIPVFKNDTVTILSNLADSVLWAYFYPCQGNI